MLSGQRARREARKDEAGVNRATAWAGAMVGHCKRIRNIIVACVHILPSSLFSHGVLLVERDALCRRWARPPQARCA